MTRLEPDLERTLRQYVLGTLEEASRLRLEEQLVRDPDVFEALGVVEDELTEAYLDSTLTDAEKRDFERHSLSSPDRRRVPEFFGALKARASTSAEASLKPRRDAASWFWSASVSPAWLGAAAALLVFSLAANVWLASRAPSPGSAQMPTALSEPVRPSLATPAEPSSARLAELAAANRELETRLDAERRQLAEAQTLLQDLERTASAPTTAVPTFTLAAGLLRSGGSLTRVVVPSGVDVVRLVLDLPGDDYPLYRVALHDVDGDEIWAQSKLRAESTEEQIVVAVLVPAAVLVHGDYQMKVSGLTESGDLEGLASYTFRALPDRDVRPGAEGQR